MGVVALGEVTSLVGVLPSAEGSNVLPPPLALNDRARF